MGLNIKEIVPKKEISFAELRGKTVVIDGFNALYQFLSSIRQYDGTPLMDDKGRITSHLSGLFYRNTNLLLEGLKIAYVFDGKPPELKGQTGEKRAEIKRVAGEKYEEAKLRENYAEMRKYSQQMSKLTDEMIKESKELLQAMGIAVIQAPGEGEAQASYMAKNDGVFAVASQDYDCLVFGAPKLIQNLTLSRKRKTVSGYVEVVPQLIELDAVLKELKINQEQLTCLSILVGTDYNIGGVKGIGQKKALKLVQELKTPEKIFGSFEDLDFDWEEIFELMKNPDVDKKLKIEFSEINENKIKKILKEHDFSEERINKQLEKLREVKKVRSQKTLF